MARLPPAGTLQTLSPEEQATVVDTLFEHSPTLRALITPLLANQYYPSYPALVAHVGHRLSYLLHSGEHGKIDAILCAHPRLGERREAVSELSRVEQANLTRATTNDPAARRASTAEDSAAGSTGLARHTEERAPGDDSNRSQYNEVNLESIASELRRWNEVYEERFPGLRYVTFVNNRPREVIIQDMINRIHRGDIDRERSEAISAICLIAIDRARRLEGL